MLRKLLLVVSIATACCVIHSASVYPMGGNLSRPRIAIPTPSEDGKYNSTVVAMNKVLGAHEKQFVGGHFINAHTVLHFTGGTKTINSLLNELSKFDGAVVRILFSKGLGSIAEPFTDPVRESKSCDFAIDHNGWANAHELTMIIYLGSDNITLEDLALPAVHGRADCK